MIIVSQNKDVIVNFNNIENIWINTPPVSGLNSIANALDVNIKELLENNEGKFELRAESYSNNMVIGKYTTEERAKEVLREITRYYRMFNGVKDMNNPIKLGIIKEIEKNGQDIYVYTMPKE